MTYPVKLRKDIQYSDISIIIDDPTVLYRATVAVAGLDAVLWTVAFTPDAGSGAPAPGTLTDCLEDMTILIGTAAGLGDIGAARLRRTSGGADTVFYIGADPSLVITFGDYLTVIDDFELWAKHPNAALLDVDVAVGTAFTQFVPIPWFNGRYAVIDPGGTVNFNASRSWCPGNTISAYSWSAPGSTTSGAPSPGTFWAHYHTTGRYRVSLEVTATTTGMTFKGYGYVYVRGSGVDEITDVISLDAIEGDADGGYVCSVELVDRPTILDRRRVIIFAEDYYGADASSFGPVYGRENILMVGWIDGETINRTPEKDTVTFEIGGPLSLMNSLSTQPAGIQDTSFPADKGQTPLSGWATQAGLTAAKALQYLALYRSTMARFMDFSVEDWVFLSGKLTSEGDNLLSQVTDFAGKNALNVRADRIGRVFVERDTQLYPVASRTANIPTACTLLDTDIQGELNIIRRQRGAAAMATAEGTIYFLSIVTQVGGRSPGDQPARCGSIYSLNDLSVSTQGDVLELSGLLAGCKNQEIEMITAVLAENNRLMDITPRMFVEVTVDGTLLRCIPRMVRYERNPETGFMHTELDLEPEGNEWPSVVITYPGEGEPPVDPPTEPPEPPPEPPGPPDPPDEPSETDAVVSVSADVRTSADLDIASPTWTSEL